MFGLGNEKDIDNYSFTEFDDFYDCSQELNNLFDSKKKPKEDKVCNCKIDKDFDTQKNAMAQSEISIDHYSVLEHTKKKNCEKKAEREEVNLSEFIKKNFKGCKSIYNIVTYYKTGLLFQALIENSSANLVEKIYFSVSLLK